MNKKVKKLKSGIARNQVIIIAAIVIVILVIAISLINSSNKEKAKQNNEVTATSTHENYTENSDGTKTNISPKLLEMKQIGQVRIEDTKLVYENGKTTLTARLVNDSKARENLRLKVRLMTPDGGGIMREVEIMVGNVFPNEMKLITTTIEEEMVDINDVTYEIVK